MDLLLDRYEVLGTLGSGAQAEVLRVRDRQRGGRVVALKRARAPGRLLDEVECLRSLRHPNLPEIYDVHADTGDGRAAYTLEVVEGEALDTVAEQVGAAAVPGLLLGLLRALAAIHARGLVHGDLHPRNVLVSGGAAGLRSALSAVSESAAAVEAVAGTVRLLDVAPDAAQAFGALPFVAPERLEGGPATPASDCFSVGVLLHLLVAGALPYPDYPAMTGEPAGASRLGNFGPLVRSMLDAAPRRPQSAARAVESLAQLLGQPLSLLTREAVRGGLRSAPVRSPEVPSTPGVTLWRGVPGSGRSRLLVQTEMRLLRAGVLPIRIGAEADDAPGALFARLRAALPPALSRLLPGPVDRADDDVARSVAIAVGRSIDGLCTAHRQRPFQLLVDDVHTATAFDQRVLGGFVRAAPDAVLWATASPEMPGDWCRGAALRELGLPRLDAGGVAAVLHAGFGGLEPADALVEALLLRSGGHPELTISIAEAALQAGALAFDHARVTLAGELPTDGAAPLEALSTTDRALALLIHRAPLPVPERVLTLALGPTALTALSRLDRLAVLRPVVSLGESAWRVARPGVAAALAAAEPDAEATAFDAALADLEDGPLSPASAAVTASAALRLDDGEAPRALAAAQRLLELGHAGAALSLIESVKSPVDPRLRGEALARLGRDAEALECYGRLPPGDAVRLRALLLLRRGRYPEADAVLAQADDADSALLRARSAIMQNHVDRALAECERARGRADDPALLTVRGLGHFYRAEYPEALAALGAARAAFEARNELVERANVENAIGLVHYRRSELDAALQHYNEALRLARESGDAERALLTLMNVAIIEQSRGHYALAESRYAEALGRARVLAHRAGTLKVAQNLGNLLRYLGALGDARRYLEEALALAREDQNAYQTAYCTGLLGEVAWAESSEGADGAEALLEEAAAGFAATGSTAELADAHAHLSALALRRGDVGRAATYLAGAEGCANPAVQLHAQLVASDLARSKGDPDLALARARAAEQLLGDRQNTDRGWQVALAVHRALRDQADANALEAGLKALSALEALADALPDTRRAAFLAVRSRREALSELTWLRVLATAQRAGGTASLTRLLAVNERLSAEHDPTRLLEYIIDSAVQLTSAERGFVLLRSADGADGMDVAVARNIDQENIKNRKFKVSYSIAQRVFETGDAVLTTDAMGDDRYSQYLSIHHLKLRSVLCVPLRRGSEVIGALYVDNRFQSNAFSASDLETMKAFGHQAAIALGNARLLDERQRMLEELEKRRAEVQALNQRLSERLAEKERALEETQRLLVVQRQAPRGSRTYPELIGDSPAIRAVFHILDRVQSSDIPVLVTGESGTGKELVARAIHTTSQRKDRAFIAINCSSIPETLFESELFGHVRGAFTGATGDKKGVFEAADKGTLFLDEIGEMPLEMQAKLLRALQEGEIQKVGSPRVTKVDVRIVAATNRVLRERVAHKQFREDLYYRLAVVTLELPSLRERLEDVPTLIRHFLDKNRRDGLGKVREISPEGLRLLMRYRWPGNVRELETVIKNASIFCEGDTLRPEDFSNFPGIVGVEHTAAPPMSHAVRPLGELEREAIVHALEVFSGNKKKAAEELGIDRRTLYNKLAQYGIAVERRAQVMDKDD